ncbi:MAG: GTP 3',8-cyclase MoaA [Desulfurococcaceae archaeon]
MRSSTFHGPLVDSYGRPVDSLRVSVTYQCNYRCIFCHAEGLHSTSGERDLLDPGDYEFIAEVLSEFNVRYYKLTGGEPLLRRDIHEIVAGLKKYAEEVSLVTNGSLLLEKAKLLAEAGLDRLNVSLHAIKSETYEYVTGGSKLLSRVLAGVDEALKHGLKVKLNFLLLRSNVEELPRVLEYAMLRGLSINIIELEPIGVPRDVYLREHVPVSSVLDYLEKLSVEKQRRGFQNRPVYVLPGDVKVEIVVGFQNKYLCSACTRLRLTPNGCFKTCLYVDNPVVCVVDAVKRRDRSELAELFKKAVNLRKPYFT